MTPNEMINKIENVLLTTRIGVLVTVDENNAPHARWLVPTFLKENRYAMYALSSPSFKWLKQIEKNPQVQWMIQKPALDQIFNIQGKMNIIDNPSIRTEILDMIGQHIMVLWNIDEDVSNFLALETIIESVSLFHPMKIEKTIVNFMGENVDER